mgnify:FL=1
MRSAFIVVALAAGVLMPACTGSKKSSPTRIQADNRKITGPAAPAKTYEGPFRNPDKDPPPPRSGEQLAPEALEQALKTAREQVASGLTSKATMTLKTCANKIPQDLRCEAELGILLAGMKRHRQDARYYLNETATVDDPQASAELFRRLADAMRLQGMHRLTGDVYRRMIEHGANSAEDYVLMSKGYQADASRLEEAADAMAKARALDPSKAEWLHDEGLLRAQVAGQSAQAASLLKQFLEKTRGTNPELEQVLEARVAELSGLGEVEMAAKPLEPQTPKPLVQ